MMIERTMAGKRLALALRAAVASDGSRTAAEWDVLRAAVASVEDVEQRAELGRELESRARGIPCSE